MEAARGGTFGRSPLRQADRGAAAQDTGRVRERQSDRPADGRARPQRRARRHDRPSAEGRGHEVEREYYFNNAGRQMQVLGASVRARYLEHARPAVELPEDGYQGDYIREIARALGSARAGSPADDHEPFQEAGEQAIFAEIRRTQERLGVRFDNYFNEDGLYGRARSSGSSTSSARAAWSIGARGPSGSAVSRSGCPRIGCSSRAPASPPIGCPTSPTTGTSSRVASTTDRRAWRRSHR